MNLIAYLIRKLSPNSSVNTNMIYQSSKYQFIYALITVTIGIFGLITVIISYNKYTKYGASQEGISFVTFLFTSHHYHQPHSALHSLSSLTSNGQYPPKYQTERYFSFKQLLLRDSLIVAPKEKIGEQLSDNQIEGCVDETWCKVPIPKKSLFRYSNYINSAKLWRRAQNAAARGEPILIRQIIKFFPNYLDFIDGDVTFRSTHMLADYFFDKEHSFQILVNPEEMADRLKQQQLNQTAMADALRRDSGYRGKKREKERERKRLKQQKLEEQGKVAATGSAKRRLSTSISLGQRYLADTASQATPPTDKSSSSKPLVPDYYAPEYNLPPVYHAIRAKRAPIIHSGYFTFDKYPAASSPFTGKRLPKDVIYGTKTISKEYLKYAPYISHPYIFISIFNENWGLFSTYFPNRTVDWGYCCTKITQQNMKMMLDSKYLLMLLVNQHNNFSHPKILTLPRGLPIHDDYMRQKIWDRMRLATTTLKNRFLYTASSNWKFRPRIKQCISDRLKIDDTIYQNSSFIGYDADLKTRVDPLDYYRDLASSRMSIALPGLGYDTFR
jgi:hypothetical protein